MPGLKVIADRMQGTGLRLSQAYHVRSVGFAPKVNMQKQKTRPPLTESGRYNLCEDVRFAGVYPHAGTLQRLKTHPARWLHKWVT